MIYYEPYHPAASETFLMLSGDMAASAKWEVITE